MIYTIFAGFAGLKVRGQLNQTEGSRLSNKSNIGYYLSVTYFIENKCNDPAFNLALEQYVFDSLDRAFNYFLLWQNDNSIIVGKHQNTIAEINQSFVKMNNINVVRRLSGGGSVYHDFGNINFTFIADSKEDRKTDFSFFCSIIQKALVSFGVPALISGRNDIIADDEKKISGNAQYAREGRVMHHGTLLYDTNLDALSGALNVTDDKLESRGIKSVKSRVANIRGYMKNDMPAEIFLAELKKYFFKELDLYEYCLSPFDLLKVDEIKENRYSKWSWNYGSSPPYNIKKTRRIEGCGKIEVLLNVGKEGIIENVAFYGDFFNIDDLCLLAEKIKGNHLEYNELYSVLKEIDLPRFISNITLEGFLALVFE